MKKRHLYLGTRKGLIKAEGSGKEWKITQASFQGVSVPMFLPDRRDGRLIAAVEHGHFGTKLQASENGGADWVEMGVPLYPTGEPEVICAMSQRPIPQSLEKIWALEAGGGDEAEVLWCGTIPGGLFKSLDGGASWNLVEGLWQRPERKEWFGGGMDWPGIHSITVDPRDSRHVTIAISCGGVWDTRDGGENWNLLGEGLVADFMPPDQAGNPNIQDAHRVVACQSNPDHLWMQHHNGIFRSTDAAKTWERITTANPSDFGFSVAVHPLDPLTAWFVPGTLDDQRFPVNASLCAMRTRDGGKTFEALRTGLPQEQAYHLIYRHCLDVSDDGEVLAFGSTTGSVWISDDGGDSWERISSDLPPIYCLRFG